MESIVVASAIAMLLSCSNDIKEVQKLTAEENKPITYGKDIVLLYSDSLVLKYKVTTKEYVEKLNGEEVVNEFPKGMFTEIFEKDSSKTTIKSQYALYSKKHKIWTAKYAVEIVTATGDKINTELLYWDMTKGLIYSDKYVRTISNDGQILEGYNGFRYDQKIQKIELNEVAGDLNL
jgi:LPS export ABC transporter protein LptC